MKKLLVTFAMTLSMATGHCALHAQQPHHAAAGSLTGTWTLSIEDMSMPLELTQDGNAVTGTLGSPHGPIRVAGEVDGESLKFSGATATTPVLEVSATGTSRPDGSLAGSLTINVADGVMTWTAVRTH